LKELPVHLSEDATKPAIISSFLSALEEEKLMRVFKDNQSPLGWNILDLKGISPAYCINKIHLEAEYKTLVQA